MRTRPARPAPPVPPVGRGRTRCGPRPARPRPTGPPRRDAGTVTAETAVVLPALVLVVAAAVWLLLCVAAQLQCVDAAGLAARAAARGDAPEAVSALAARVAPAGARVHVSRSAGQVEVLVRAAVRPSGVLGFLPDVPVSGRAVAADEREIAP